MKKFFFVISLLVMFVGTSLAQVTVTIPEKTLTTSGETFSLPINVTDFNNIGAISLKIEYDQSALTFNNVTTSLSASLITSESNGVITIGWFSPDGSTALNVPDGKFVDLNFTHKSGNSDVSFQLNKCEVTDINQAALQVSYTNGKVIAPQNNTPTTGIVGGIVWDDLNADGIKDQGEPGVGWVTVKIINSNTGAGDWVLSDNDGKFSFEEPAGDYYLEFILVDGNAHYKFTANNKDSKVDPSTGKTAVFTVTAGQNDLSWLAGLCDSAVAPPPPPPVVQKGSIGDFVWEDTNGNGLQDQGESGIPGITVKLIDANPSNPETEIASTTSGNDGHYEFTDLDAGTYKVKFELKNNYSFSPKNVYGTDSTDSDPDQSGKTDAYILAEGENLNTVDCGMIPPANLVPGSIGDLVWNDSNMNGIQDQGESGLEGVTVKLLNADNNDAEVASTTTDSNGKYNFDNVNPGNYKIEVILLSNYVFTKKDANSNGSDDIDSDVNPATGKSAVFSLCDGQDLVTVDAGMYLSIPSGSPQLCLNKDDGIEFVPPLNDTYTYTIKYVNYGNASLLNGVISDPLPEGLTFVEASNGGSETTSGSNVVEFHLGTLAAGDSGEVTVKVQVTDEKDEYVNTATLAGVDENFNNYSVCATDVDLGNDCSGGDGSGVESRGDLAELLLQRQLKIRYGMATPVVAKSKSSVVTSQYTLPEFIPNVGPYQSKAVETTPFDILGISNAVASYAVDYDLQTAHGQRRVAGVFSTITVAPKIYDHTKAICDRLGGYEIDDVNLVNINGYKFYEAKLVNKNKQLTDHALSFSIYATPNGFSVQSKWTYEEYQAPDGATNVYNFQVWSASSQGAVELAKNIIANFGSKGNISYMNISQPQPNVFIKSARYMHDGTVHLDIINKTDAALQISLNTKYRISQGDDLLQITDKYTVKAGENNIVVDLGIVSDANVYMSQTASFKDEVFVSGGAYTYLTGANSKVDNFSTSGYAQQSVTNYPEGSLVLAGGASAGGEVNDWVTIMRALTAGGTAYDLSNYSKVKFEAAGSGTVEVILDMTNVQNFNYYAYKINLTPENKIYEVSFNDFKELYGNQVPFDAGKIRGIGFVFTSAENQNNVNFNINVQNIAFLKTSITGVNDGTANMPKEFSLAQNYPNPFNPSTKIEFTVPNREMVSLTVYNVLGQVVKTLVNGQLEPGTHFVNFDAGNLASGIYFYKLKSASVDITKKMILTK